MSEEFDVYEAAVLSLTMRADYAAQVYEKIKPTDFSSQLRDYAEASYELLQAGKPVDAVTVGELLESRGHEFAGRMLGEVFDYVGKTSIENLDAYCQILRSRGLKRDLLTASFAARQILEDESDAFAAHQKIMAKFEGVEVALSDDAIWDSQRASRAYIQEMQERNEAGGELIGLSTGFKHLDDRINGLREGDLVIVAGRPSMGKTTFALNMVEHNAIREEEPAIVFSMEMPMSQIMDKMHASLGGIPLNSLRRGCLTDEEWSRFAAASRMIQDANFHIDDRAGLSVAQMRARCHEVKRKTGRIGLIMVDYIQLMQAVAESRTQEITKITSGLKALGKEFKCPVIALSQLSRKVEERSDKRPLLSDLRESGSIEQDADIIIFPYRAGYYEDRENPDPLTEIITGKIRMGEVGSDGLEFQGSYSRFAPLDREIDFAAQRAQADYMKAKNKQGGRRGMDL